MTIPTKRRLPSPRRRLLQGASVAAFAAALAGSAHAQLAVLQGAGHVAVNATGAPGVAAPVVPGLATQTPAATTAAAQSLQNAMRAQQAVNIGLQAQAAARQAAAALPGGVPNGLAPGGLVPVLTPTLAANDPTGLNTWQGANLPTQTVGADGGVTVDIRQTAARAILDWKTFNVGAATTLNFDQSQNGVAQRDWVALNRVVGQLDPRTGLRDPSQAPAPSQILGAIKAQGTVLVINQNGVLFGAGAQINTNSLVAATAEIGAANKPALFSIRGSQAQISTTLADRDNAFLTTGLLLPPDPTTKAQPSTFSGQTTTTIKTDASGAPIDVAIVQDAMPQGAISVAAGASITGGQGGFIILAAPKLTNAGVLTAAQGQVSLIGASGFSLIPSTGAANGVEPNVRGLLIGALAGTTSDYAINAAGGVIRSPEGYASMTTLGADINAGVIAATTSVSRNGFIQLNAPRVELASTSVLAVTPEDAVATPQDPNSLKNFKPSLISIGAADMIPTDASFNQLIAGSVIDLASGGLIYAPAANVYVGARPGADTGGAAGGRVFVDSGVVIDVAGLKNVAAPSSTRQITISPVTSNDTADTPAGRNVLNHATVTIDPRLSGVRSDGVSWVGSPLIPAGAYAQQAGVTASQLMTKGGNVVLGAAGGPNASGAAPDVIVKRGAIIDVSGGWLNFAGGWVQTTQLLDAAGRIVDIGHADPDDVYVGVYNGFTTVQQRFGIARSYANPLLAGAHYEDAYSQGGDAGSLTIRSSQPLLEGTVRADAFPGTAQIQAGQLGTGKSTVYGDQRRVQAVGSQMPVNGMLLFQQTDYSAAPLLSGGDVAIVGGPVQNLADNLTFGQAASIDANGNLVAPVRPPEAAIPPAARGKLTLSADTLSSWGLGQLSFDTSGALTVASDADLKLAPGGAFTAVTGRAITLDGRVTAPAGLIDLATVQSDQGSIFAPAPAVAGSFDIRVNGQLSAAGLWVNDSRPGPTGALGAAYVNGGAIRLSAAPRQNLLGLTSDSGKGDIATVTQTTSGQRPTSTVDISGSVLAAGPRSLLDVSSGGYVAPDGTLALAAKGGDLSLTAATAYFPFALAYQNGLTSARQSGAMPGFRVNGINSAPNTPQAGIDVLPVNPNAIAAKVALGDGVVRGHGFGGGGTFNLITPAFSLSSGIADTGTNLPLDFFSKAGFGTYNVTSYATALLPNTFSNGYGGYNAVLATQIVKVGNGQVLDLTQSGYTRRLTGDQIASLRDLATGGRVSDILPPTVEPSAFDQRPIALNLGGLIELEVAAGGKVTGAAGAQLSVAQVNNMGVIRLPGGALNQVQVLPANYDKSSVVAGTPYFQGVVSAPSLSQIFSTRADGLIDENAPSLVDPTVTNGRLAATRTIYLTGDLPAGVGLNMAAGSVTDLSGVSLRDPYAVGVTQGRQVVTGRVVAGGAVGSAVANLVASSGQLFPIANFETNLAYVASGSNPHTIRSGLSLAAAPGATLNLAGASDTFDQLTASGQFVAIPQWSSAGALSIGAGGVLTGATIDAHGGAPTAAGGVLALSTSGAGAVSLAADDAAGGALNTYSVKQIQSAGFGVLAVQGDLATTGAAPVDLTLGQAFFLTSLPSTLNPFFSPASLSDMQALAPTISVAGSLRIKAPYVALQGAFQKLSNPAVGTPGSGQVSFSAQMLDVTGAVLFDRNVARVDLTSQGDIRFVGVQALQIPGQAFTPSLFGQLAVNGALNLTAAQVYAATGGSYDVTSAAAAGVITIAPNGPTPATPYSAGSSLLIQAANIVQNGVVRAPIGALTLGGAAPLILGASGANTVFAPATTSLTLGAGSLTSVSADGLSIPYGVTTDQSEYYFSPTNANPLTAPPAAVLTLAGRTVTTAAGATINLKGGGDVYAYEFIPGSGGSRDVLSQYNPDAYSGNNGYQFPDRRQVYAIVPGLSQAPAAASDPIYSANYADLYGPAQAGRRVYLDGGNGVAAGWYTLLPAQYAMLPGGMEVVEDTGARTVSVGASLTLPDGVVAMSGRYGGLGGAADSTSRVFDVKSQAVIRSYSNLALTSADAYFQAKAAKNGLNAPRLPIDAGRLVINPGAALDLSGTFLTAPGAKGRGAQADITAPSIQVVSQPADATPGVIQLSADQLTALNADSLLIGGLRSDNADGSTTLQVTAKQIVVANNAAHPLSAPDLVLAVDGQGAAITVKDGAAITASGADVTGQTGAYVVDGATPGMTGQGALIRVSAGPQRLLTRKNVNTATTAGGLTVGAATLSGASVMLGSTNGFGLSTAANLQAGALSLDSTLIAFAPSAQGLSGLVITPDLSPALARAQSLTLRSANVITFAAGAYGFGDLRLDTPGLGVSGGAGAVSVNAQAVQLQNTAADAGACGAAGATLCGGGQFALSTQSLTFGDGAMHIYGAAQGVTLSAAQGMFFQGRGGLGVGAAPLLLQTPFLGDRAAPDAKIGVAASVPSLTLATTGDLTVANPTAAAAPAAAGLPGATLILTGNQLSVTGADVRATAGVLTLNAAKGVSAGPGAILETPGYSRRFGDAADPYTISAPGGLLTLNAASGDINLAPGSVLSVGGGTGAAGRLTLNAGKGTVNFGGRLDASAPAGGGGFLLNEAGAFDLAGFARSSAGAFNGVIAIETGAGDLSLSSGLTLKATTVSLTADGGLVDIAGTIDASGVNGGLIGLFGARGVTLENGSAILARASGYGAGDTRQAKGGEVQLGVSGDGAITLAQGAVIDVSAANTAARAVPMTLNGVTYYSYVPGDVGGVVSFRAPVSGANGAQSVKVAVAGSVTGARSVVLEGYKAFDLGAVAAGGQFSGVKIIGGVATLDVNAAGQPNFLADNAPGTLVNFIQTFDVSSSYANLGGLASAANFHARPGVQLDYAGAVTLASNWNLGAGVVDIAGAVAAGLMTPSQAIAGAYAVKPGAEAAVLAGYTKMTYRVGGGVLGEPGELSVRASGQLTLAGSITDGFFTFGDQTDSRYLNTVLGAGTKLFNGLLTTNCTAACAAVGAYSPTNSGAAVGVNFPGAGALGTVQAPLANPAPYNAAANAPGALGGDPIASAQLFPLIQAGSGTRAVDSWSYQLVGGAAAGSANPARVQSDSAAGGLIVQGQRSYSYGGVRAVASLSDTLLFNVAGRSVTADQWLGAQLGSNPTLNNNSLTRFSFTSAPAGAQSTLAAMAASFFAAYPGQFTFTGPAGAPTGVSTTLSLAAAFLQQVATAWPTLKTNFNPPNSTIPPSTTVTASNLVRTGTGSISLAAAGDIDLTGGAPPALLDPVTGRPSASGFQQGGAAVYTAGRLVVPTLTATTDQATGLSLTLDPTGYASVPVDLNALNYNYATPGVLAANPVYATGGGDVSLKAGGDIIGRRDALVGARAQAASTSFVGGPDQPWRTGTVGMATNVRINPQMFSDGAGALGGGDLRVSAGGDVSDLTMVADTSLTTARVSGPGTAAGQSSLALMTFGGGDIHLIAGGDLIGGRLDVASGAADLSVGGGVRGAGALKLVNRTDDGLLNVRLTDTTVDLKAHGDVALHGVSALGVQTTNFTSGADIVNNADSLGFYSGRAGFSVISDGGVTLANSRDGSVPSLATGLLYTAVLPGSFQAASLAGDLSLKGGADLVLLAPSAAGTLTLAAGGDIKPVSLAMLDNDPGLTPGLFSQFVTDNANISPGSLGVLGLPFAFPAVLPDTPYTRLLQQHAAGVPHRGDPTPNRLYAGGNINQVVLSVPKQTRIGAGRDIVDMMFFGQNLNPGDITRVVAGRDITASTQLQQAVVSLNSVVQATYGPPQPTLQGNTFILGGPGSLMLEAGRDLGPFLNSAIVTARPGDASTREMFGGGVISVGNEWNPYLGPQGASIDVSFGVAKGQNFDALRSYYLDPANAAARPDYLYVENLNANNVYVPDKTQPIYAPKLIAYMKASQAAALVAAFGSTDVTYDQAYSAFSRLSALDQRPFLLQVYFSELSLTATPGPTLKQYARGYTAVNLLFPAALGYTANNLEGGGNGANAQMKTGDLDLRLAAIETKRGGDIAILGPGGRVLAGSTVATAQQAARRNSAAPLLFRGNPPTSSGFVLGTGGSGVVAVNAIDAIPAGYEGVLTLRGGTVSTFTDGDFVLNQSRLFTEQGGDIIMWSSNGDLNAGQGPKTSSNFPPAVVKIDDDGFSKLDQASAVTGAGIAGLKPAPGIRPPDVYTIAPRGTVDAGAAGIRVAGNIFVAALHVANADNFQVGGVAIGLPPTNTTVSVSSQSSATSASAMQAAQQALGRSRNANDRSIITVEVLGFGDQACAEPGAKGCPAN